MKIIKILLISLVMMGVIYLILSPGEERNSNRIKIGTPDDLGGLIIQYIINEKGFQEGEISLQLEESFEVCEIKDCCTSSFEWALSSEALDLAVMCPDAAAKLLQKDSRYEVVGPCLANSNILITRSDLKPLKIGVGQNRSYQVEIVQEILGDDGMPVPMMMTALPYAYEKKAVDGVVIDILKGIFLDGQKTSSYQDGKDNIAYVLVVRKTLKDDPRLKKFFQLYHEAVGELNQPEILCREVNAYHNLDLTVEEVEKWIQLGIRYLYITAETSE